MVADGPFAKLSEEQRLDHQRSVATTMVYVMEFLNQVFDANRCIVGFCPTGAVSLSHDVRGYIMSLSPFERVLANAPASSSLMKEIYAKLSAIVAENDGEILVKGTKKALAVALSTKEYGSEMLRFS
jgi:type IV secretory pathway protease TraF